VQAVPRAPPPGGQRADRAAGFINVADGADKAALTTRCHRPPIPPRTPNLDEAHTASTLVRRLERLGYAVELKAAKSLQTADVFS